MEEVGEHRLRRKSFVSRKLIFPSNRQISSHPLHIEYPQRDVTSMYAIQRRDFKRHLKYATKLALNYTFIKQLVQFHGKD